jgi:ribosomal protein L11 methylase PrmA
MAQKKKAALSRKHAMPAKKKLGAKKMTKGVTKKPRSTAKTKATALGKRKAAISSITETAKAFFVACEAGKGWEGCGAYCTPNATFSAQAEPLASSNTLREYTEWMKGLLTVRLRRVYWHAPSKRSLSANGQDREDRLRLRHAVQGRQDRAHDEDLAFGPGV